VCEYCLTRHAGERLVGHTWAECLKEIGAQFGWTLQVSVESEGVIRITVLDCRFGESEESEAYLCEFGSALFGGVMAEAFGDVKVCVSRCSETPPLHCVFAIHYRTSEESQKASGVVYQRIGDQPSQRAEGPLQRKLGARLTSRETQVLQHIAHGLPDRQIAESLQLSVRTVENHAARIRKKLGADNRTALVRLALRAGLIEL
jgi:DNA-binding CsgD family transcriptional regulator